MFGSASRQAMVGLLVNYSSDESVIITSGTDARRVGSGVVRIDPLRFLAGCRKRRLNQALSVLFFSLGFFSECAVVLLTRATFCDVLFCVTCVFCLLVVLVRLSVPVQVTGWKDSSPK